MTSRQNGRRRTRGVAVLVASILLIIGLIAWIAVAHQNGAGSDFRGSGNGEEEVVELSLIHI